MAIGANMWTFVKFSFRKQFYNLTITASSCQVVCYFCCNCPTTILNRDVAPIGNDIEAVDVFRDDVRMGNDEDEGTIGSKDSQSENKPEESEEPYEIE